MKKAISFAGSFVAGVGGYLVDTVRRLVKAFTRSVYGLGATFYLEANCALGHVSDHGAGMAVRLVCLCRRVVHLNDSRAQVTTIQLRQ